MKKLDLSSVPSKFSDRLEGTLSLRCILRFDPSSPSHRRQDDLRWVATLLDFEANQNRSELEAVSSNFVGGLWTNKASITHHKPQ